MRLRSQGYHFNHVHSQGWLSSAYYVSLPPGMKAGGARDGWLKFGESNIGLGAREEIGRYVEPEEGLLVLFPSCMFHGTVPFADDAERLTVAFDVVPDD